MLGGRFFGGLESEMNVGKWEGGNHDGGTLANRLDCSLNKNMRGCARIVGNCCQKVQMYQVLQIAQGWFEVWGLLLNADGVWEMV